LVAVECFECGSHLYFDRAVVAIFNFLSRGH